MCQCHVVIERVCWVEVSRMVHLQQAHLMLVNLQLQDFIWEGYSHIANNLPITGPGMSSGFIAAQQSSLGYTRF